MMSSQNICFFLTFSLCLWSSLSKMRWNAVDKMHLLKNHEMYILGTTPMCTYIKGLSPGQVKMCQLYQDYMPSVKRGAMMGRNECQWQFRTSLWNCSSIHDDDDIFGSVTDIPSREAAFIHAITSAGIAHTVSRTCAEGRLSKCHCSERERPKHLKNQWMWGGCGDNVDFGYDFAVEFIDIRETEKNHPRKSKELSRMLMNVHNNEAGRLAVKNHVRIACKCHGVSGSCNVKTCWFQVEPFRSIGARLKERYKLSTHMRFNKRGTKLMPSLPSLPKPTKEHLVYLQDSPNYCNTDLTKGSLGTTGRRCIKGDSGTSGCQKMCCGRGYKKKLVKTTVRCGCKFQWCCFVKCDECSRINTVYECK